MKHLIYIRFGSDGKEPACDACNSGNLCLILGVRKIPCRREWQRTPVSLPGVLAWRIPRTEEPNGLQSVGSQRVGHNWVTNTFFSFFTYKDTLTLICFSILKSHEPDIFLSMKSEDFIRFKNNDLGLILQEILNIHIQLNPIFKVKRYIP